jgi:hypothetical protein
MQTLSILAGVGDPAMEAAGVQSSAARVRPLRAAWTCRGSWRSPAALASARSSQTQSFARRCRRQVPPRGEGERLRGGRLGCDEAVGCGVAVPVRYLLRETDISGPRVATQRNGHEETPQRFNYRELGAL